MAFNITSSPGNAEILASLLGDTTGLSNIQITTTGNPLAVGLFQDSPVNLSSGVLLSTGQVARLVGSNTSDRSNVSTVFNTPGTATNGNDAITLEITFDADAVSRQLFFQYVFGSEEFLDFAGSSFNDRITFELNGVNLARLNNGNLVSVNSLTPVNDPSTFSPDYINNLSGENPAYERTVLDGYTVPLTLQGNLLPNANNRLVITIQDIGDGAVDSAVFLAASSLGVSAPTPTVNVTAELPNSIDEDGVLGIFYTFTRTGAIDKALSVNYQLGGTATFDTDYSAPDFPGQSGTVNFAPGSFSTTISIPPRIDTLVEGDETVIVNLLPASNAEYVVGVNGSATGTILDEDTPLNNIRLTISPNTVVEGDSGSGNLVYTFTRIGSTTESLRVDYNVGGTALFFDDYDVRGASFFQNSFGSITFEVGTDTAFLTVDHKSDNITEEPETIDITLTPSRNDTLPGGRGRSYIIDTPNAVVGNIIDSPPALPVISLEVQPNIVGENDQTSLSYFFTRTGSTTSPLTIQYFVRGTASLDTDYTVAGAASFNDTIGTVTFQAGSDFAAVDITPTADSVPEPTETVILQLDTIAGAIGGYNINTFSEVVGSIVDVATPIINVVLEPQSTEEGSQTHLFYGFSRSGSTNDALTVNYNISGTAAFGTDYSQTGASSFNGTSGSITFAAGSSTANLGIAPATDVVLDPDETIVLTLADSPSYAIGNNNSATGTIRDVSPIILSTVSLALNQTSVNEDGIANLSYTFTRTGSTDQPLTVRYRIVGTAIEGSDYSTLGTTSGESTLRTFDFAPGASTFTIRIDPTPDTLVEGNETIDITLITGSGYGNPEYIVGNSTAVTGTIIDIPPVIPPSIGLNLSPTTVTEDGTANLVYTFSRTGSLTNPLDVSYSVAGTATDSSDYSFIGTSTLGTITFATGSDTAQLIIDPTSDLSIESSETVEIALINPASGIYTVATPDVLVGTISDPDVAAPIINVVLEPQSTEEGSQTHLFYGFSRSGLTNEALTVNYNISGTAAFGTDYSQTGASSFNSTSGSITFAAGSSTANLEITPVTDAVLDPDETIVLALADSPSYAIGSSNSATGTIRDVPTIILATVSLALNQTSVDEDGTDSLSYTFTRNGSTNQPLTVRYQIAGTAIEDTDYSTLGTTAAGNGFRTFDFAPGASTFTIRIDPTPDALVEGNETVSLALLPAGLGYGSTEYIVDNSAAVIGTILDQDDNSVSLAVSPSPVAEDGTENLVYTFTRTGSLGAPLIISYNVSGTATFRDDYIQSGANNFTVGTSTIEFASNSSTATLTITPIADSISEPNETVDLTLLSGSGYGNSNYIIGTPNTQTGTIININEPPTSGLNFIGTNNLDVGTVNNSSNGIFAVNPNNINFVGDEINLLGGADSVSVPNKNITLQPNSPNQAVQIGSVDSNSTSILDLTPTDLAAISNGFSRIIFGRASGTGNININSNITFRDPVLLQSPGGQLNITAPISLIDDATLDFNVQTLVKSGNSILTIDGNTATTFIGNTTIDGGVLVLAKSPNTEALSNAPILINSGVLRLGNNEQINNGADLTLNGGTFNLNGFNETLDQLQVTSNSTISLGNRSSKLAFGNSSTANWTGSLLIENWSSTSGETIRFGNSATGLTTTQLNDIQFVGFNRGASISTSGFITPVGITVINPPPDQDGVSDDTEDLAPNGGDGNFDGIRDSLQENVVSILNLGGTDVNSIATIMAKAGTKISGLRSLANPIITANLTSLANPIEFKVTGLANGAATTVEYIIAKADQNRRYNTYLMFGASADNATPHAYEFLFDGQTGAELFDTTGDGFVDKAIVHFIDGQRGDSDLTVNGEIQDPGAPGISSTPVSLSLDNNNVVQVTGAAGTAITSFSLVANQTKQVSEVGFFKLDPNNTVGGIAVNAAGFARTALQNGQVIFSSLADNLLSTADISRQLQLNAGDRLGFYLVQNGTVDHALQKNNFSNVVFSLDQANPAGRKALEVTTETNGSYRLKWEQGSATVADDLILNLQLQSAPLNSQNLVAGIQGDREGELLDLSSFTGQDVQVNFTIKREAAFNDMVGFYKIEDAQGTVISITGARIKPGEAGYQAAVVQSRIAGIDLAVANGQTVSINAVLQGGAIYAPFLIANANPSSLNGNFSNVYTSYIVGNADTTDHVRLLGDNTFGFEDLAGGGDRDFNDVVLRAVFKNS